RAAGKPLFGAYRNPLTDDPSVKGRIRSTANTTPIVHAGKLFALKEDGPPLIMDVLSMDTEGFSNFNGAMKNQTFSAHPKICPDTGNMCNFGYAATGLLTTDCSYMEVSPTGELLFESFFTVPYYCMMHDFALTEHYALFHLVPITSNWDRLKANKPHFGFDTSMPVYLGVLPRDPKGGAIRWFKAPKTVFASHVLNAYEEGSRIHFLIPEAEGNCFPFFPDINDAPFDRAKATPVMTRWVVDMASTGENFESVTRVSDHVGEFPRVDDRAVGKKNRHGWMLSMNMEMPWEGAGSRAAGFIMNTLVHFDFQTNLQHVFWCGPQSIMQEPCFIARRGSTEEGDGYIVALQDNVVTNYSELLFLDARNIAAGAVARAKLPFRLRSGLHGTWINAEHVPGA
ncbi:MAG: carotenoid oxygenase family protein, partial [Gammaproteobacteria bacterium]|nr:carotenoid oxygenase family protein [Gammaproteobacteria bacterium]